MPKYTADELKTKAAIALADLAEGGSRGVQLLTVMCIKTGLPLDQVIGQIEELIYE